MKFNVHAVAIGAVLLLALPGQLQARALPKWALCEYEVGTQVDREYVTLIIRIADYELRYQTKFVIPTKQTNFKDAGVTDQSTNCENEASELMTEYVKIVPKYIDLLVGTCEFEITSECADGQQELTDQYTEYILLEIAHWRHCHGDESDDRSCMTELVELTMQYTEYSDKEPYIGMLCNPKGLQEPAEEEPAGLRKDMINQMLMSQATAHQNEMEWEESDKAILKLLSKLLLQRI